jgi:hypothetical protein
MRLAQRHQIALVEPQVWPVANLLNVVRLGRQGHDALGQAVNAKRMLPQISEPEDAPLMVVPALMRCSARWPLLRLVLLAVTRLDKLWTAGTSARLLWPLRHLLLAAPHREPGCDQRLAVGCLMTDSQQCTECDDAQRPQMIGDAGERFDYALEVLGDHAFFSPASVQPRRSSSR